MKKQIHISNSEVVVAIQHLVKSFDTKMVLNGISLNLYKGENLVILGRSGSGKSVLIKIIAGLLQPDSGSIKVLGQNLGTISKKELDRLRLMLGFSFQNSALYDSMTVSENLEFPILRHLKGMSAKNRTKRIQTTLEAVDMLPYKDQYPVDLSGGQKKRVGIARTLIMQPVIMLYDEPTAGLDPITSSEIINLINSVQELYKTSSIIITHDLTCAKATGDRMIVLKEGAIVTEGSVEQVFAGENDLIKSFYDYNFVD